MTLGGPPAAILLVKPKMRNLMVHHSGGSQSTASPGLLPDTSHPTAAQCLPRPPTALTQHHLAPFSAQHACSGLSGGSNHRLSVSLPLAAGTAAADGMRADCGPSRKNLIPDNKTLQCAFAFHLPRRGNLQDASILSFESRDNGSAPTSLLSKFPTVCLPGCSGLLFIWPALDAVQTLEGLPPRTELPGPIRSTPAINPSPGRSDPQNG